MSRLLILTLFISTVTSQNSQDLSSYTAHTVPQLTKQPENAFGKEGKPLTLKCRGTSQPPPSFSWYLNNKEITADQTMFTRTVEGDLTISSFNSLEHAGTYNCLMRVVDVRDPSTDQDDLELKLRSRDAVVKAYGTPTEFLSDVTASTGYAGGMMRFSIDASNIEPYPQVGWNYKGRPTIRNNDPRFFVLPQGVLQISGLGANDAGDIRAVARLRGSGGFLTGKYAKLDIKSATDRPSNRGFYFLGKPQSIDLRWGKSAILEAVADSANPVSYTWYKDGQPLALTKQKSVVGAGNLQILLAKEEDAGVYKVVAESAGQKIEAEATVNVLFVPAFTVVPQERYTAYEGGTVEVKFKMIGAGNDLKMAWYLDGQQLTASADYIEYGQDFLKLSDLITTDAGMYQLHVSNSVGDAQLAFELVVLPPPQTTTESPIITDAPVPVPGKPREVKAYAQSSTSITISWQEPADTNGAVTGYQIIYFSSMDTAIKKEVSGNDRLVTLDGLQPGTQYTFRVLASNSGGSGPLSDTVTATTNPLIVVPDPIGKITYKVVGGTSLSISWPTPTSGGAVTKYLISYVNLGLSGSSAVIYETTAHSAIIKGLQPGGKYSFNITPFSGVTSGPKSPDYTIEIPKAPPQSPKKIGNLNIVTTSSMATLTWTNNPQGPAPDSYMVYYDRPGNPFPTGPKSIKASGKISYIRNLDPFTNYVFWVVPFSGAIPGPESNRFKIKTDAAAPGRVPNLRLVSRSPNMLKVRWNDIPLPFQYGGLTGYRVRIFKPGKKGDTLFVSSLLSPSTRVLKLIGLGRDGLKKLNPNTVYNVAVRGENSAGAGDYTTAPFKTRIVTSDGPSEPNMFFATHNPDRPDVISVTWDEPTDVIGDIKKYIIYWQLSGNADWNEITVPGTATSADIINFTIGSSYRVYMQAVDANGKGSNTNTEFVVTLKEDEAPSDVTSLSVGSTADSLMAKWVAPAGNVVVRGYKVVVTEAASGKVIYEQTLNGRQNKEFLLFNQIEAGTDYTVVVKAFNKFGESTGATDSTTTAAAPKPSILVDTVVEKKRSIYFTWKDSEAPSGGYAIQYKVYDIHGNASIKTAGAKTAEFTADGLTPYTTYNFYVMREGDADYPASSTLDAKTAEAIPSAPLDLTALTDADHSTSILLNWQVPQSPNGKLLHYNIYFTTNPKAPKKEWPMITTKSVSMYHNLTGLTADTPYSLAVQAVNGAGAGPISEPVKHTTEAAAVIGGGTAPVEGGEGVAGATGTTGARKGDHGGFEMWWLLLILLAILLLILLILLLVYCCCCRKSGPCFGVCPCCETLWHCCLLPCLVCCCPCCCKKKGKKAAADKAYVAAPLTAVSAVDGGGAKNGSVKAAPPDLWLNTGKQENVELLPLKGAAVDAGAGGGGIGAGAGLGAGGVGIAGGAALGAGAGKDSVANVKVPIPGDTTFISYKTSLQDYCHKVGWLPPTYSTQQLTQGCSSRVAFASSSYDSGAEFGVSKQDAEQRAAFHALLGLGVLGAGARYNPDALNMSFEGPIETSTLQTSSHTSSTSSSAAVLELTHAGSGGLEFQAAGETSSGVTVGGTGAKDAAVEALVREAQALALESEALSVAAGGDAQINTSSSEATETVTATGNTVVIQSTSENMGVSTLTPQTPSSPISISISMTGISDMANSSSTEVTTQVESTQHSESVVGFGAELDAAFGLQARSNSRAGSRGGSRANSTSDLSADMSSDSPLMIKSTTKVTKIRVIKQGSTVSSSGSENFMISSEDAEKQGLLRSPNSTTDIKINV